MQCGFSDPFCNCILIKILKYKPELYLKNDQSRSLPDFDMFDDLHILFASFFPGRYGVLLASRRKEIEEEITTEDIDLLRVNICHHVIGMNPLSIGELTEKDIAKFSAKPSLEETEISEGEQQTVEPVTQAKAEAAEQSGQTDEEAENEESREQEVGLKESNETRLLFQSYLMDPTVSVGEILYRSGLEVVAFERFECGETAEEVNSQQDVALAAAASA